MTNIKCCVNCIHFAYLSYCTVRKRGPDRPTLLRGEGIDPFKENDCIDFRAISRAKGENDE